MNTLTNRVNAFIAKYEAMSPNEFAEYFARQVGSTTTSRTSVPIITTDVIFSHIELMAADCNSFFIADPANDSPYELEYLECA
jgi:hypothetical protein